MLFLAIYLGMTVPESPKNVSSSQRKKEASVPHVANYNYAAQVFPLIFYHAIHCAPLWVSLEAMKVAPIAL